MPFQRGSSSSPSSNNSSNNPSNSTNRNIHNQPIDPLTACLDADGTYLCVVSNPRCYIIQKVNPQGPSPLNPPRPTGWINHNENNNDFENAASTSDLEGTRGAGSGGNGICHHHHHHPHYQYHQHRQLPHLPQITNSVSYMNGESSKVNSEIAYVGTTTVSESSEAPMAGPTGSSMAPQHPTHHHSHEYMSPPPQQPPPPPSSQPSLQDPSMVSLHNTPVVNRLADLTDGQIMGYSEASGGSGGGPLPPGASSSSNYHLRPQQSSHQQNDSIEKLKSQILFQILFYFSPQNLARDRYLLSQMDNDQYVPISTIASFNLVKDLTTDLDLITETLKESNAVEVDAEGLKVRPNPQRCIVILREIPDNTPVEEIKDLFMGENCPRILSCEFVHNESWYITFETSEDAQKAYFYLREEVKVFQGRPIMARIKANTNHGLLNQPTPSTSSSLVTSQVKNGYRNTSTPHAVYDPASYPPGQQRFVYTNGTPGQSVAPVPATAAAAAAAATAASYNPIVYPYQHQYPNAAYVAWPPSASGYFDISPVFQVNGLAPQQFKQHAAYRPSPTRPRSTTKHRSIQAPSTETNSTEQQGPSSLQNQNRIGSGTQQQPQQHSSYPQQQQHHQQSQQPNNNNQSVGGVSLNGTAPNQNVSSLNQNKLSSKIVREGGVTRVIADTSSETHSATGSYASTAAATVPPTTVSSVTNDAAAATHSDTNTEVYGYALQQQQQSQSFLLKDSSIPPRYRRKPRREDDIINGNGHVDNASSVQTQTQQLNSSEQSQGSKTQFDYVDEAFPPLPGGLGTNGFASSSKHHHHHHSHHSSNQQQPQQQGNQTLKAHHHHSERTSQTSGNVIASGPAINESTPWGDIVKGVAKSKISSNDRSEEKELVNGEVEPKEIVVASKDLEKEKPVVTETKNSTSSVEPVRINKPANRTVVSVKCTMTDKSTRTDDLPNGCEQDNGCYPTTTNAATMTTSGIVQAETAIKTKTVMTNSAFPKHDAKDPAYTEMFPALPTSDDVGPPRKSYAQVTQHLTKDNQPKTVAVKQNVEKSSSSAVVAAESNATTTTAPVAAATAVVVVNNVKTSPSNQNQAPLVGARGGAGQVPISERDGIKEYRDGNSSSNYRSDRMGGGRNINHRYGAGGNGPGGPGGGSGGRRKSEVRQSPQLRDFVVTRSSK